MNKIPVLITALFVCSVCCLAEQPALVDPPCVPDTPCVVNTKYGQFLLSARIVSEKYGLPKLKGEIVNNTRKDWLGLEFKLAYYDASGTRIETIFKPVYVGNLEKGASYSLGSGYGEQIIPRNSPFESGPHITRFAVTFVNGKVPAKYAFLLVKKTPSKAAEPKAAESPELVYSDDFTDFKFSISKTQFGFVLRNKSEEPIQVDWNQVAYVDVSGESHKVIHSGVKYIDRDKPLAPTTVPPSAKIDDILFPADYVYYSEGEYGGWRELPLFPDGDNAELYKGKTFTVFMPLKVNGVVKNYTFKFKIASVEV